MVYLQQRDIRHIVYKKLSKQKIQKGASRDGSICRDDKTINGSSGSSLWSNQSKASNVIGIEYVRAEKPIERTDYDRATYGSTGMLVVTG